MQTLMQSLILCICNREGEGQRVFMLVPSWALNLSARFWSAHMDIVLVVCQRSIVGPILWWEREFQTKVGNFRFLLKKCNLIYNFPVGFFLGRLFQLCSAMCLFNNGNLIVLFYIEWIRWPRPKHLSLMTPMKGGQWITTCGQWITF